MEIDYGRGIIDYGRGTIDYRRIILKFAHMRKFE